MATRDWDLASRDSYLVKSFGAAAALLLAASPVLAQDSNTASNAPEPAAETVGPRELSNFSLNGTVTREAQPDAQRPASTVRQPSPRSEPPASASAERPAPPRAAPSGESPPRPAVSALDAVPSRPQARQAAEAAAAAATASPAFSTPIASPPPAEPASGLSPLPWLAALLLLGAGAAIYFGRRRQQGRYAVAGVSELAGHPAEPAAPAPRPAPQPTPPPVMRRPEPRPAPAPAPAPIPAGRVTSSLKAPATPPGVVTASLRPWIELELEPSQALVNDEHAAIAFDVTLFNSGSAPARDVAVEACMINAGQQQDVQLSEFFTKPGEVGDKIPTVAPMARITLKSAVRLPRSAVREYEVEGRKLFMPMVAISSRYRWSSGEGQSAAGFLVGRAANDSEKLAPLRLDQGARGWKGLAARRYEKGIRR